MKKKLALLALLALLLPRGAAFAQEAPPPAPPAPTAQPAQETVKTKSLIDLIISGGWAMWFLGACSVAMVTMATMNAQRIRKSKLMPMAVVVQMESAARQQDLQTVWNLATSTDSFFTRCLAAGLRHLDPEDPMGSKPRVEAALGENIGREESKYGFYVNFLALLTSMSPMWGLLGTVSGMIRAFAKIGGGGMGKPEMLAKNISEALVCTATGLMIAIFSMFFYFLYRNMLNAIMKESEGHFSEILDGLTGVGTGFGQAESAPSTPAE